MKKLRELYEDLFDKPDTLIQLKSEEDSIVFDLAVSYPDKEEDLPDSSVTSLGLSAISKKKGHSIEFFTEILGKVSNDTVNDIGELYHTVFNLLESEKEIVAGKIYRSLSLPPFDNMNAVMITEKIYSQEEWLDEVNEKGKLMRLIPLFEKEADELEQYQPELRHKLVVRSNVPYRNPDRQPAEITNSAFLIDWNQIASWYKKHKVKDAALLETSLKVKSATSAGNELEKKLEFKLPADFKASFDMQHEKIVVGDFTLLDEAEILHTMMNMNKLNNKGQFKSALKKLQKDNRLQEQWWNEKWIPIAANSQNDKLCIDMAPGPKGIVGQLIMFYAEEGPMSSGYDSFFDYLHDYVTKLKNNEFKVDKDGDLVEI